MGTDDKAQINLRVDQAQKQDWEQYVEESNRFSSLSGLIRTAVEAEIADDSAASAIESPALSDDVNELMEDVDRIRKDVRWLREQQQDAVDISGLSQDVFDELTELPDSAASTVPDGVDDEQAFHRQEAAQQVIRAESEDDEYTPQTAHAIADRLGVEPSDVEEAVEHLQDQFLPIIEVELNGQTQYFKEE